VIHNLALILWDSYLECILGGIPGCSLLEGVSTRLKCDPNKAKCLANLNTCLHTIDFAGTYSQQCNETASVGNVFDEVKRTEIVALIGPACSDDVQVILEIERGGELSEK